MREILFRGKRTDNGEWVYGYVCQDTIVGTKCCVKFVIHTPTDTPFDDKWYEVDENSISEFTGLCDKNGTRIFEGDILKIKSYDYDYEYMTSVFYSCHTLCVDVYGQDYDSTAIGFADDIWDDECCEIEVIGNIHDNPELLKEV